MDPLELFRNVTRDANRTAHFVLFCVAGVGALVSGIYALRFWTRVRRQRQWQRHLEKVKQELADLEFQQVSRGYYRPREAGELVGAGRGRR